MRPVLTARSRRCFELTFRDTCVLLDFDAGHSSLLHYEPLLHGAASSHEPRCLRTNGRWIVAGEPQYEMPELEDLDAGGIEAVLITSADAMAALPFLTEYTTFCGAIYATTASIQLGRQLMIELATLPRLAKERLSSCSSTRVSSVEVESAPPSVASHLWELAGRSRLAYTEHDVEACVRRMTAVSFGQSLQLGGGLSAVALPCAAPPPPIPKESHTKTSDVRLCRDGRWRDHPNATSYSCSANLRSRTSSRRRSGASVGGALWHVHSASFSFVYCAACTPEGLSRVQAAEAVAGAGPPIGSSGREGGDELKKGGGGDSVGGGRGGSSGSSGSGGSGGSGGGGGADASADSGGASSVGGCTELQLPSAGTAERALLLSDVRPPSSPHPASALATACDAACRACAAGGNVLVPCTFHGATLGFIEVLARA